MKYRIVILQLLLACISSAVIAQGRFVTVNGNKIYVDIQGKQSRSTIVFVSGAGEDHATWGDVQLALSKSARTFLTTALASASQIL